LGKKIAITGGSGFIGLSLMNHFSNNFEVKILDIKQPQQEIANKIDFVPCDIRSYEDVEKSLRDVDLVIHAAIIQIPLINEKRRLGYDVNITGTQNVCEVVDKNPRIKGMILTGTWHTIGERELSGVVNEELGYRPDKVEDRARLYVLSKIAQESIVRFYDEMSTKVFGIIRMGTVLGQGMPEKTAASLFIERGLRGESITPYRHSMYRPMIYVDIEDICQAFESFAVKILNDEVEKGANSLNHIINIFYPEPTTILELARIVREAIIRYTNSTICPRIEIIDTGKPPLFKEDDKSRFRVDTTKAIHFLGLTRYRSPKESIEKIIKYRLKNRGIKCEDPSLSPHGKIARRKSK